MSSDRNHGPGVRADKSLDLREVDDVDIVSSLVLNGDVGKLNDEQLTRYYVAECRRLGLDPLSKPFDVLKLQGREILYANRRCADQLAALHCVTRTIVEGPDVRDFGGTKVLYAKCRAAMPSGRVEEDVATIPANDVVNGLMKVVTKSRRRATLTICGWGGMDESELETVPGAQPQARHVVVTVECDALAKARAKLAEAGTCETLDQGEALYEDYQADILAQTGGDVDERAKLASAVIAHLEARGVTCRTELQKRWNANNSARAAARRAAHAPETTPIPEAPAFCAAIAGVRTGRELVALGPQVDATHAAERGAVVEAYVGAFERVIADTTTLAALDAMAKAVVKLKPAKLAGEVVAGTAEAFARRRRELTVPPDGTDGAGGPPANDARADDPEREAIADEPAAGAVATLEGTWADKLAEINSRVHAVRAWTKYGRGRPAGAVRDVMLQLLAQRLIAVGAAASMRDAYAILGEDWQRADEAAA